MSRLLFVFLAICVAFAADDPWAKVKDLKTGTEIRIYKVSGKQPILAKMDELGDESLVVILKNEQTAIPRDEIERIDARPQAKTSRVTPEHKTTTTTDLPEPVGPRPVPGSGSGVGSSTSTSSGLSMGSKPDFETIYRRSAAPPPAK